MGGSDDVGRSRVRSRTVEKRMMLGEGEVGI